MRYQALLEWFKPYKRFFTKQFFLLFLAVVAVSFNAFFWSAPAAFPAGSAYDLKSGEVYAKTAYNLLNMGVIRSPFWFKTFIYLFSFGERKTIAGDYALYARQNAIELAWRISHGDFDVKPLKITIPEGLNSYQIADIYAKYIPTFNKQIFLNLIKSQNLEGYLFPDTYLLLPNTDENDIIKIMKGNFDEKIKMAESGIKTFGKPESDVIKMASILEDEANTDESRKIIAGILWKRIKLGMALQVDSSFKYIDYLYSTTTHDLKSDSLYNSYNHSGLPPTPISNPGLSAIEDAIEPTATPYLYFLSDSEGNIHYAKTLEEQDTNIAKYLK